MNLRMLVLVAVLICPPAFAQAVSSPDWIGSYARSADVVVDATIVSIRPAGYQYQSFSDECGFIHEATITESFKGSRTGTIVFADTLPLVPQSRVLLFLRNYERFSSDGGAIFLDPEDPDFNAKVVRAKASCEAGLPQLKMGAWFPLVPSRDGRNWFLEIDGFVLPDSAASSIKVPQAIVDGKPLRASEYGSSPIVNIPGFRSRRQAIEWNTLRRQLIDFNLEKVRPSYATLTLEQATVAMKSNLDSILRMVSGKRELIAAIRSSQNAWESWVQTSCNSLASAWPTSDMQAPLARECKQRLTRMRVRELETLAYPPDWYLFMGHDCDEACWRNQLTVETREINERLRRLPEWIAGKPAIAAPVEATRKSLDAWTGANCRMIAMRWPESSAKDALQTRCQLRAIREWESVARMYAPVTEEQLRKWIQREAARQVSQ